MHTTCHWTLEPLEPDQRGVVVDTRPVEDLVPAALAAVLPTAEPRDPSPSIPRPAPGPRPERR